MKRSRVNLDPEILAWGLYSYKNRFEYLGYVSVGRSVLLEGVNAWWTRFDEEHKTYCAGVYTKIEYKWGWRHCKSTYAKLHRLLRWKWMSFRKKEKEKQITLVTWEVEWKEISLLSMVFESNLRGETNSFLKALEIPIEWKQLFNSAFPTINIYSFSVLM